METEKFIMLIRERRFLYDALDADYKKREKVTEAWLEIAREMGNKNVKQWTTKWKSLRDNYKKFKRSTDKTSGPAYNKYKNWPWAEHLRFLDETVALQETDRKINRKNRNKSQISDPNNQIRPGTSNSVHSQDSVTVSTLSRPGISKHDHQNSANNNKKSQNCDSDAQKHLFKYLQETSNKGKFDDIDQLFQSYATCLKKMPARMQSMLKLDIATLFAKYEMQVQDNINIAAANSPTNSSTPDTSEDTMCYQMLRE